MTPRWMAALALGLGLVLALTGCADHPARTSPPSHSPKARPGPRQEPPLPEQTGIPVCDEYLSSYVACHRAAGIFPPDQVDAHYREIRRTLLGDSVDPDIRPQLAIRCNALARSLRQALHGRACSPEAAPAGGSD